MQILECLCKVPKFLFNHSQIHIDVHLVNLFVRALCKVKCLLEIGPCLCIVLSLRFQNSKVIVREETLRIYLKGCVIACLSLLGLPCSFLYDPQIVVYSDLLTKLSLDLAIKKD